MGDDASDKSRSVLGATGERPSEAEGRVDRPSWTERTRTRPAPDSPFYVPPASDRALRWSIVILLIIPVVLAVAVFVAAMHQDWVVVAVAGILLLVFAVWRTYRIRLILRELARRRTQHPGTGGEV